MIIIERTGPLALLQDLGRPGQAHLGVSPGGAADRAALRLANRLLGNPEDAAAVECVLGGLEITAEALHWVAVTGAPTALEVDGKPRGSHTALALRPGQRLVIRPPASGLRSYLAVRGGIAAAPVLGSRSTDVLAGLGPAPLRAGQQLAVGGSAGPFPAADPVPVAPTAGPLEVLPGPRRDWFTPAAWDLLLHTGWQVSTDSDRVAVRLAGPVLPRRETAELPSEAVVRGAVQVPGSGQPLVFGPDHPVTGGYPVLAVLTAAACDRAAQLRPGDVVRFVPAGTMLPAWPSARSSSPTAGRSPSG